MAYFGIDTTASTKRKSAIIRSTVLRLSTLHRNWLLPQILEKFQSFFFIRVCLLSTVMNLLLSLHHVSYANETAKRNPN